MPRTSATLPDGSERTVVRHGEGGAPVTALIMGMSGTHHTWGAPFLDALTSRGREAVAVEHRGVAGSGGDASAFSVADLADDQVAAWDALGLEGPLDVLGISMGGMVAQEVVLRHPERVRSLVIGCSTAGGGVAHWPAPADMQGLMTAYQSGDLMTALRAMWEINVSAEQAADEAAFARFVEGARADPVALRLVQVQLAACGAHDASNRLGAVAVPTTVVHGTEDRMLPYPNGPAIAERVPGARLDTMDGVGHLFFWERPEESAEIAVATAARAD